MADWNSLRPLKNQANVMTLVVLILAAVLIFFPKRGYNNNEVKSSWSPTRSARVNAIGGISIRKQPSINGELILKLSNNDTLRVLDDNVRGDQINGEIGNWFKVECKGVNGYAWGKYIEQ